MSLFADLKGRLNNDTPVSMAVSVPDSIYIRQPSFDVRVDFQSNSGETLTINKVTVALVKKSANPDVTNDEQLSQTSSNQSLQLMPKSTQTITVTVPITASAFIEELNGGSNAVQKTTAKVMGILDDISKENAVLRKYVVDVYAVLNNGHNLNKQTAVRIDSSGSPSVGWHA